MAGFRQIVQRGGYAPGLAQDPEEAEVIPVVPIRAEDLGDGESVSVLTQMGDPFQQLESHSTKAEQGTAEVEPAEAEVDIEARIAEAEERGRREAREELADAMRGYEASKNQLEEIAKSVDGSRKVWAQELRKAAGDLVLQTLERLVSEVPELLDEHLRKGCELAAETLVNSQTVELVVHPDDEPLAAELVGHRSGWSIRTDDGIRGGCVIEAPSGRLDASLDAALNSISEAIAHWRSEFSGQDEPGS